MVDVGTFHMGWLVGFPDDFFYVHDRHMMFACSKFFCGRGSFCSMRRYGDVEDLEKEGKLKTP